MDRIFFGLQNFGTVDTLQLICFKHTLVGFTHYVKFLETFIEIWAFLIYIHIYVCATYILNQPPPAESPNEFKNMF